MKQVRDRQRRGSSIAYSIMQEAGSNMKFTEKRGRGRNQKSLDTKLSDLIKNRTYVRKTGSSSAGVEIFSAWVDNRTSAHDRNRLKSRLG